MRLQPDSFVMAALLTALVAIAPLSTDMYLPALPAIGAYFTATTAEVQLTLSVYLIGFAAGQLILGPLSDRHGRRPVLIGGLVIFLISTAACVMANNITFLITARFFQAIGACAGAAVGRAVVRDIYDTKDAARLLAHMGTAMAAGPLVAPLIGGQLTVYYGWQSNFVALGILSAILLLVTLMKLPESHTHRDFNALNPQRMVMNYTALMRNVDFRAFSFANAFSFAGLFAFISGSSFVLINGFGLDPEMFGFAFGAVVLGYMTGTQLAAYMLKTTEVERLVGIGGRIGLIAGHAGLLTVLVAPPSIFTIIAPMFCYTFAVGFVMPNSTAGAIAPFPHMAGAASALMGFILMTLAATAGVLVGQLYNGTAVPMMAVIATTGTIAWIFAMRVEKQAETRALNPQKST